MRRLKVLLLPVRQLFHPWCDDVIEAIGDRHDLTVFDESQPLVPQFDGIEVVIDHGGSASNRAMMDAAKDVRFWQILGTGFDHFDLEYMRTKGVPVANCPGQFSSVALAETAMMFILMLAHQYRQAVSNFGRRIMYQPVVQELTDLELGIIGFGASGQDLARRAKVFGMRILAIDVRTIEARVLEEIRPDFMGTPDSLDQVISGSDFLSLHLHLNATTRHIIDARRIGIMKRKACLINVARGALVDEKALFDALVSSKIGGAGLDVFEHEPPDLEADVFQLPNVVVTPHIAGGTVETSRRRALCAAENVDRIAQGLEAMHRIDVAT